MITVLFLAGNSFVPRRRNHKSCLAVEAVAVVVGAAVDLVLPLLPRVLLLLAPPHLRHLRPLLLQPLPPQPKPQV